MEYIGRQGRIHWYPTNAWHRARVVDYDSDTGAHQLVWYDDWRVSDLYLGGISSPGEGVHGFQPDRRAQKRHLAGKRIVLEPDNSEELARPDNTRAHTDFRGCVLARAKDFPNGRGQSHYHVFYLESQVIVTVNLAKVRYELIEVDTDTGSEEVVEMRNPDMPRVHLGEPMRLSPLDDYVGSAPVYELMRTYALVRANE